jgi:periplasmic copper chaperone A
VKEVVWSGGKLADDNYDEFVISTFLAGNLKPNTMLYFPTVQECEQGVSRWIEIPAQGAVDDGHEGGKWPAPGAKLMPKP